MTDIRTIIAELRELEAKATPGSYYFLPVYYPNGIAQTFKVCSTLGGKSDIGVCECDGEGDAEYIASALDAMPQLLDYIARLEAVARSLDIILRTHSGYECARDALDALESD